MAEDDLINALVNTIHSESNNNPPPKLCTIKKVYETHKHIDAQLEDGSLLEYIKTIGNPVVNEEVIVVFIDGETSNPVAIAK